MECCGDVSCLCIPVDKEESIEWKDKNHHGSIGKSSADQQLHKSDTISSCLAQPDLMAGWQTGFRSAIPSICDIN